MNECSNIFFVGIGGASMSALAVLSKNLGANVEGCDDNLCGDYCDVLLKNNIKTLNTESVKSLEGKTLVVYSSAIPDDNPVIALAKRQNIKTVSRAEFLAKVMEQFEYPISVCGSHGKSTTTAMIYKALKRANLKPSLHLGAILRDEQTNVCFDERKFFVCESCEYKNNFRFLKPKICVVLNVDYDHPDYFKNLLEVEKVYKDFAKKANCLICHESCAKLFNHQNKFVYGFGDDVNFCAKNITFNNGYTFDFYKDGIYVCNIKTSAYALHDVCNILATLSVCSVLGIDVLSFCDVFCKFKGIARRFEFLTSKIKNATFISDYAHHPTEIIDSLRRFSLLKQKKKIVVFQPHTYSRTKKLFSDFVSVFTKYNFFSLLLYKTYSAREIFDENGDCKTLATEIAKTKPCLYFDDINVLHEYLKAECGGADDVAVMLLGAGDLDSIRKLL